MSGDSGRGSVWVVGAGSIGCYVGGCLQALGTTVRFVGRPRVLDVLRMHGLTVSDLDGGHAHIAPAQLSLHTELPAGPAPSLVLLCVKSGATQQAAADIALWLPAGTPVLSLQNGIGNAALAQAHAPHLHVLPGMVPFNVAELADGCFHRGTSGELAAQDDAALRPWQAQFRAAGLGLQLHADLRALQWGKLLVNLNNPVNALSGLPLRAQLLDRDLRRSVAALQDEALAVLDAAGIEVARVTPLPAHRVPGVLRLPNWAFRLVAARMLRIDDKARSSMADDLALGRTTEIDALCGEVVRLAASVNMSAPRNATMVRLLSARHPSPMSGRVLRRELGA